MPSAASYATLLDPSRPSHRQLARRASSTRSSDVGAGRSHSCRDLRGAAPRTDWSDGPFAREVDLVRLHLAPIRSRLGAGRVVRAGGVPRRDLTGGRTASSPARSRVGLRDPLARAWRRHGAAALGRLAGRAPGRVRPPRRPTPRSRRIDEALEEQVEHDERDRRREGRGRDRQHPGEHDVAARRPTEPPTAGRSSRRP